jgi:hypothetical protein
MDFILMHQSFVRFLVNIFNFLDWESRIRAPDVEMCAMQTSLFVYIVPLITGARVITSK